MDWVDAHPTYRLEAKNEFARNADGWLIAYSIVHAATVVPLEQPAPHSAKDIKIPDVCDQFNVAWVNTFDMLESLGIRFDFREDLVAT